MNVVITALNEENWESGIKLIRTLKQDFIKSAIVNTGLRSDNLSRLKDLKIDILDFRERFNVLELDVLNSILPYLQKGIKYCFCEPTHYINPCEYWEQVEQFGAIIEEASISSLVYPLAKITHRARFSKLLESKVPLSGSVLVGTDYGWNCFVTLYNLLVASKVVETHIPTKRLAVNLFALYFPCAVFTKEKIEVE